MKNKPDRFVLAKSWRGFSLIEVLVSMTLSLMVILTVLAATGMTTRGYQGATRRIDTMVEARGALRILADDVSTILGVEANEFDWDNSDENFHEIWFKTLKPIDAQDQDEAVGDVCYVHYFTAVTPDSPVEGSAITRKLYRRFLDSSEVLESIRSQTLPEPDADPEQAEVVAFNVMGFQVSPRSRNSSSGDDGTREDLQQLGIELFVLDNETSARFQTSADWSYETQLAQNLLQSGENSDAKIGDRFRIELELRNES